MNLGLISQWASDAITRGMAPKSIDSYRSYVKDFQKFCDSKPIEKADKLTIRAYIEHMRGRKMTTRTIRGHLNALSSFYEFLVFEDLRPDNPIIGVRKRYASAYKSDSEEHTHKLISVEEAARLVNSCIDVRDKAMILVLLKTGVRRGELLSMEVSDISWDSQSITLKPKKKRSNRIVFFDSETEYILKRWLDVRANRSPRSDALWITTTGRPLERTGLSRDINLAGIRVGLHDPKSARMEDHFSAHCCRHWNATHLLRAGMPREFVQWLRGDTMKEAIDIYNHIAPEDVRKSYLAHVPALGV